MDDLVYRTDDKGSYSINNINCKRTQSYKFLWKFLLVFGFLISIATGCSNENPTTINFLKDFNEQCQVLQKQITKIPIEGMVAIAYTDKFWEEIDSLDEIWKRHPSEKSSKNDDIISALNMSEKIYTGIKQLQKEHIQGGGGGYNAWLNILDDLNATVAKF